ncbi:sensor histidine kinase [Aureimonas sp. D3]|uniref:sensor histidine kinase n=1 Tax=Aureimonas sp. D3 TaxID=1638164 RepID=UPI00078426E1
MSLAPPPSLNETLPHRGPATRRGDVTETVRSARDRLLSPAGLPPRIELALLRQHVGQLLVGVPIVSGLVAVLAIAAGLREASFAWIWIVSHLVASGFLLGVVLRFEASTRPIFQAQSWKRLFLAGHFLSGLPWALLWLWPLCRSCGPIDTNALLFATSLGAIATVAMIGAALGGVVIATFLPLVGALAFRATTSQDASEQALYGLLICAIPFFTLVADRLRRGSVERLRHRAERDQLVSEIETARIQSDEARQRAEEANLAKSQFLATMSHELRTPLNAILGFSEVISNEILGPVGNETYRDYVNDIHQSGQHLLDLINEILDLSRVEAGRYTLNEEPLLLANKAREGIGYVQLKADTKRISIVSEFEPNLPQLWGDPRSLRQVVLNLLSNAVKFTPEGGRIVCRVGWTAGGGQYVSVSDNGPGIPAEELPTVLSSFGQGSSAIKSAEQGTGLGLPIVQALMTLHNGRFELHSELGRGTEAIAIFPHSRVLEVMPAMQDFV